jgi:hypothetical protein
MATAAATLDSAASDLDLLHQLNHDYVRSVQESDVGWFDANLSDDFLNSNPDGTLVDRAGFLTQIAKKSPAKRMCASSSVATSPSFTRARATPSLTASKAAAATPISGGSAMAVGSASPRM